VANELKNVQRKFADLIRSELRKFPDARQKLEAPTERGVYVIYGPRGEALHVGGTPRAKNGIRQRLTDHLHARSSFTEKSKYLRNKVKRGTQQGRSDWVRSNCSYRCLPIEDDRMRALLECYTIGQLCPDHIGIHRTEA
jgi:hypothetical protein